MTLQAIREAAAAVVTDAGLQCHAYLPGRVAPPCAVVQPGEPYVEAGDTFDFHLLRLEIVVMLRTGDNALTASSIDEQVQTLLEALDDAGFIVQNVSQPTPITWNSTDYPGVILTVTHDFTL